MVEVGKKGLVRRAGKSWCKASRYLLLTRSGLFWKRHAAREWYVIRPLL